MAKNKLYAAALDEWDTAIFWPIHFMDCRIFTETNTHAMKSLVSTIIVLSCCFPGKTIAQCPVAGSDSSVTYCWHEAFDLSTLLSADADTNGVFFNPAGDTINPPEDTLSIPGVYTYTYIVSDSACENDTAKFYITIYNCPIGGVGEVLNESTLLAYPNPATDQLVLHDKAVDELLIYDKRGRCVYRQSTPMSSVIDISRLDAGLYLLVIRQDGKAGFQRFMKLAAP